MLALLAGAGAANAEDLALNIAPQPLGDALNEFAVQAKHGVVFAPGLVAQKTSPGVTSAPTAELALAQLLDGSGLTYRSNGGTFLILRADDPQSGSAAGAGAGTVEALIVTAQKREEDIQDVPIAISAFSQEDLTRSQVAGGPDLMTQVPNMTFTKTNFSSYSIQIRGIGTQAISATTDPAVAVAFNNTPFVRNRFFEQEFYDLQRIEVLRGPQGTLYGRNATAGVVNIISAKPKFIYEAKAAADLANYNSTRIEGMVNIPVVEDVVALRLAGAWTKRDGFVTNEITGNPIDGRDLWSTRLSLRITPNDRIDANLMWEHFEEDDDRLRSGKQLCKKDLKSEIEGIPIPPFNSGGGAGAVDHPAVIFSQGCVGASLYSPESFQTPNGFSLPYYQPLSNIGLPVVEGLDPYLSTVQSRDLRVIESTLDPEYRSTSDLFQLQVNFELSDGLTVTSETAYNADVLFSMQDFNRFNTAPGAFDQEVYDNRPSTNYRPGVLEDGVFCDPQLGCSDRLMAVDVSSAKSRQFSQELRLSSDFDGPFNFSLGANYLRYDTEDKYYVFINTLSMVAASGGLSISGGVADQMPPYVGGVSDNHECLTTSGSDYQTGFFEGDPTRLQKITPCVYIDPNPIGSLNDLGHNYFLSKNPYKLISYATFGEAYYQVASNVKITAGLRFTVDKKEAPRIPSWLLGARTVGYPVAETVRQEWREPTGRLTIDWKPELGFTDETLVYASYSRGYKAGGANPPPTAIIRYSTFQGGDQVLLDNSLVSPKTFDAEYIDAFEIGTKNTLFDGALTLNLGAFYYDYKGYQISQIVDRSASNSNFDAEVWGAEIELDWRPLENLKLGFKGGYENTRVADGMRAIDLMDRANGGLPDENGVSWIVARPFPTIPSNCIVPVWLVTYGGRLNVPPGRSTPNDGPCAVAYLAGLDPVTQLEYVPDPLVRAGVGTGDQPLEPKWAGYPGFDPDTAPNNGQGFYKDLGGNELPNAPHFTATITADYTLPLANNWLATLHTDLYYQSEAWTRIFNMEGYDKLKAYSNINLAAIFTNEDAGWTVMAYVKNVLDRDSITGAFLNSDDTGLTTNVFLTEPRLYGLRVTKAWTGGPLLGDFGQRRDGPRPFTVELAGGPARLQSDAETYAPPWIGLWRPSAPFPLSPQDEDLDTGDDREVRLIYRPGDGWRLTSGVRYGRANSFHQADVQENMPDACSDVPFPPYNVCGPGPVDWAWTEASDREEHVLADFMVGRDFGLGVGFSESVVSAGLRYADFKSRSMVDITSNPDFYFPPDDLLKYERNWHHYDTQAVIERKFRGVGPAVSWEASSRLLGAAAEGSVNIDWSVTGGILFGKQKTSGAEETDGREVTGSMLYGPFLGYLDQYDHTIHESAPLRTASRSVTVPTAGVSVGLSYAVDRFKVGAGYRWERYFDAIDGGLTGEKTYDRTIDGPYFKIAVGFGGG